MGERRMHVCVRKTETGEGLHWKGEQAGCASAFSCRSKDCPATSRAYLLLCTLADCISPSITLLLLPLPYAGGGGDAPDTGGGSDGPADASTGKQTDQWEVSERKGEQQRGETEEGGGGGIAKRE